MASTQKEAKTNSPIPTELKAEQALGLIGLGLMQKISKEGESGWNWTMEENGEKADLHILR